MAASRPTFKVSDRTEFGSRTTRRMRRDGIVPGVVYTGGEPARPFQADAHELSLFINEGHALFDLEIAGEGKVPVVIKEEQRHPVRGDLMHLDCQQVDLLQEIQADIAIELVGVEEAPGVKEGGVMEQVTHRLNIEALPTDIPDFITVDVSGMEIAATMHLSELTPPEGVVFLDDAEDTIIATIVVPTEVEEPEEVEEETELVGEEGEAEAAEGEPAAEESSGGDEGGESEE